MSVQASDVAIYYLPLEPSGEWLLSACEWPGRPGVYRLRIIRMGVILIDAGFKLAHGQTIKDRLGEAVEEFTKYKGNFEKLFHNGNREEGVRLPPYEKRGVTPFNCHHTEFMALVLQWKTRVPNRLLRKDFKVFQRWTDAERALRLNV